MANTSMGRFSRLALVLLAALVAAVMFVAPMTAWGQTTNAGTITGNVTDNTNAAVPDATVTITLKSTGVVRTATTNNEGRYVFANVDPGAYDLKVTKAGFSSTVISNQTVNVGTQLTENVQLQVGTVSTTVEVTSIPGADLQTLNATVGTTLSGAIILNLPNTSRDASTLAILQPGQNINGNTGGAASDQNSFQLDGGYATDDMSGDNNTYIPSFSGDTAGGAGGYHSAGFNQAPSAVVPVPVASIEEFKVSTANQTADFNGGAGSQVELVTKRGTKTLHGSVYEYYLDTSFGGANTWDNNSRGRNLNGTDKFPIVSSHFSRFGASAGGMIPHSNFLGGSWYLFGNYEGFRFPSNNTFSRNFPTATLRAGLIQLNGEVININPKPTADPLTGTIYAANTGTCVSSKGCAKGTIPQGALVPCPGANGGPAGCDPRGFGVNPVISTLWNTYLPLPNDCSHGDGLNYCGFKGSISTPQSSNFGVARLDHDFGAKWHFNGTYHYYKLIHTVSDQWDIGGFFPGDVKGQYSAIRQKPQEPWIYTAGLTTDISPTVTNDFHYSFTRNWWAYLDPSGVPNVAGYPAALEVGGENSGAGSSPLFGPYNTNNQSTRYRYWNGHDSMYRDDVTWIKGNHLFQLGGSYLHNNDTHLRNDNGQSINTFEQYLIGAGNAASLSGFGIDMTGYIPKGVSAAKYGNLYSMLLGMVDESQSLFTRGLGSLSSGLPLDKRSSCAITGIAATSGCVASPPLSNTSIIPTYNLYFSDSWHMKPTFSLNYGLGYTVEMPPYEVNGGVQTVMVDQNNNILYAEKYLNSVKQAALQGNSYAPLIGFATVRNVNGHSHYPYDPFFLGLSPRVGFAWNFRPDTVIRGGYSRIFGRINGVNPILVPMLTPGLMQPDTCGGPQRGGGCSVAGSGNPNNVFRVGVDGVNAPLPPPSANLPQPWYPGFNDVATGSGETIDPNFKPDRSDEFTLSVQHQFGPKFIVEAGYIGRIMSNEVQYYSLTSVPYMMTRGGQTFANAWSQIMVATNYATNLPPTTITNSKGVTGPNPAYMPYVQGLAAQPFFENSLVPGYCNVTDPSTGNPVATSCTAAFVVNNAGNMNISDPFDSWAGTSNAGQFTFGRTFTNDPINSRFGANGQSPSITTTVSNGYGNYNAGYLQLTTSDWHGLTMKSNFSYSNALGTGNVVQASSSFSSVDTFNIQNNYGPQQYNEKFVFNLFFNYAPPFYASQNGVVGHLLGGWSFSPLFVWGSGFPVQILTPNGTCGTLGECNTNFIGALENGVITKDLNYSGTLKAAKGTNCGTSGPGFNVFSNPDATCPASSGTAVFGDPVRAPILGLDGQIGGGGPLTGLSFWNLDMGITKKIRVNERLSGSMYFDFTNVLNHMQPRDPAFDLADTSSWGVLGGGGSLQANTPRRLQLGISIDF
ncbi:MAG TPA: carboxypeptidase-like regulatory domain-containing protein [Candidatus Sulfotelmatobacter sp.]|nr:carboxypeptidase-like regulatory domain-containing protein [Candidatus Sulfotelmatobacter sp.]